MRLEDEGAVNVVAQAVNGLDAIRLIRLHQPDIALVDLRMPAATGIDVAAAVAKEHVPTKVLLVSACVDAAMVARARAAGAHGYLPKDASRSVLA